MPGSAERPSTRRRGAHLQLRRAPAKRRETIGPTSHERPAQAGLAPHSLERPPIWRDVEPEGRELASAHSRRTPQPTAARKNTKDANLRNGSRQHCRAAGESSQIATACMLKVVRGGSARQVVPARPVDGAGRCLAALGGCVGRRSRLARCKVLGIGPGTLRWWMGSIHSPNPYIVRDAQAELSPRMLHRAVRRPRQLNPSCSLILALKTPASLPSFYYILYCRASRRRTRICLTVELGPQ